MGTGLGGADERAALQARADSLDAENAALQRLDALKTQFVATVSHELRTPLTSICGYTELLREGALGELPPRVADALEVIDRNGQRLLQLIDRLLLLSSVDDGSFAPRRAPVQVATLVSGALTAVRPAADRADVRLVVAGLEAAVALDGDAAQLERLLVDLMANAVKFSRAGGEVRVEVDGAARPGHVLVHVADDGLGIPEADLPHLFTRFHRGQSAHAHEIQGSGLGLSVAQEIARAHGGEIAVESAVGSGSCFTVCLPLRG